MVSWKWKRSGYPSGTSGSTSEPNLASAQPDPQPEQPSGEQMPQQPALLAPPGRSRGRRVVDKVKRSLLPSSSPSPSPSPSPCLSPSLGIGSHSEAKSDKPTATPTPQPGTGDDVTAVSSGSYGSPSSSYLLYRSAHLLLKYFYVSSNLCVKYAP